MQQMLHCPRGIMRGLICGGFALALTAVPVLAAEPDGEWLTEEGAAHIRIVDCNSSKWGVVSWEKTPGGIDKNNPDANKRDRPTLGMPILLNMKRDKKEEVWKGLVYNPENGKNYESSIKLVGPDKLQIKGCVLGFLCGGQIWTKVVLDPATTTPSAPSGTKAPAQKMAPAKTTAAPTPAMPTAASKATAAPAPGAPKTMTGAMKGGAVATTTAPANPLDDVCSIPEIARATH
jgi:uncharacterized protein (DUF2147 family)